MAAFEGYGTPGTIATRQNNPGNLIYGPFAENNGAIGPGAKGIAIFPDAATGQAAQDALITKRADQGYSLSDLINSYAPPNAPGNTPESTQAYLDYVTGKLGASPSTPVSATGDTSKLSDNQFCTGAMWLNPYCWYSAVKNPGSTILGMNSTPANGAAPAFSFGRVGAFILGLLFIGGGLYLFKPSVVSSVI